MYSYLKKRPSTFFYELKIIVDLFRQYIGKDACLADLKEFFFDHFWNPPKAANQPINGRRNEWREGGV
jgi:hypothetical protein